MAILFFDGFETVGTETGLANQATIRPRVDLRYDATSGGGVPATDSYFLIDDDFSEGYAVQMGNNSFSSGNYLEITPSSIQVGPSSASTPKVIVGCRVHIPSVESRSGVILNVRGRFSAVGTDNQFTVSYDGADIKLDFGSGGAARSDTVTNVFSLNNWHYVEVKFKCAESASGGMIQIRVDGNVVLTQDPQDMNNGASVEAYEYFRFQTATATAASGDWTGYDDIYILTTESAPFDDYLGLVRARRLALESDQSVEWENKVEMTLDETLDGPAETIIDVGTGGVPAGAPQTGTLRVILDTGIPRDIAYTAHNSDDEFTVASSDWTNPDDATSGNDVFLTWSSNYDKVDENGADENDYVETDIDLRRDRYNISDLTEDDAVLAVKLEAEAINQTGGTPSLEMELQSGSTVESTKVTVDDTANYAVFVTYHEEDPDTSAEWTNAAIDAIRAGFVFDNEIG